jgi:hypothetical protein
LRALLAAAVLFTLSGCAPPENPPVCVGYLRQGFEQSDFYPGGNEFPGDDSDIRNGPWWVTVEESEQAKLDVLATGEGRGRAIVAHIMATCVAKGPVDFGFRPKFENSVHVGKILGAERVSEERFRYVADLAATRE